MTNQINYDVVVFCFFLISVLQMLPFSVSTGEVCPRFTAHGYCMRTILRSLVNLRAEGSITPRFPCRLTPFFISRVALAGLRKGLDVRIWVHLS